MKGIIKLVPNSITVSRIIMTFIFLYFIIEQFIYGKWGYMPLILVFMAICISDLIDGKLARKMRVTSVLGAKLDVFADLLYIVISYVALINLKILPLWFLVFVFLKFTEFIITSKFIKRYNNSNNVFIFDKVGRIVSALFLVIPGIACFFKCLGIYNFKSLINCILYFMAVGGVYSSYLRIKTCVFINLTKEEI